MSTQTFDQDNVFADERSAFTNDEGTGTPVPAGKTVKKGGGSIPFWVWAVCAVMVLLVTFVVFRILSGRNAEDSPAEIMPIVQSTPHHVAEPQAMPSNEPAVQQAPQPDLSMVEGASASVIPIPGEDPVAPAGAVLVQPVPVTQAPSSPAASAPAIAEPAPPANPTVQQISADERRLLNERIEALSGDVDRLKQKLKEQETQSPGRSNASPPQRKAAAPPARRIANAEKPAATPPAPILGITLKAIVDDSAWLQTESGESVMVQPGDVIHGVGTVKAVDPDAGTVRLTDGRVLR